MRSLSQSSVHNSSKMGDKEFYQGYDDNVRDKPKKLVLRSLISKKKGGLEGLRMKAVLNLPRNQGVSITVQPTSSHMQGYGNKLETSPTRFTRQRTHNTHYPTSRSVY